MGGDQGRLTPDDGLSADWPFDQPCEPEPTDHGFETDFWAYYPRREKKLDAHKAWKALKPDAALRATIRTHLQTRPWPAERQYIPLPGSFLRGYRWEDEFGPDGQQTQRAPANRWQPSEVVGTRIPDGHLWCDHSPTCASDREHLQRFIDARDNGPRPGR